MHSKIEVNRPEPIAVDVALIPFAKGTDLKSTIKALDNGEYVWINELYSDGIFLLRELHKHLRQKLPNKTFKEQQAYRAAYHRLSNLVVLEIVDHKLNVGKSPNIGWLKKLYADKDHFFLSFPQIQGMNSAWQWYKKGVSIPVLRNKIHPYYGTYFPTRFEHLEVFDTWLKRYKGPKKSAIDVGVGSGVLSLQMVQHGFQKVYATDINPNAIVGLAEFMGTTKLSRKIELDLGHLFGKWDKPTELIVFNPPWLPTSRDLDLLDKAIYYDEDIFPEFFAEAKKRLLPDGRLLFFFSNLAQITKLSEEHPVEKELAEGGRFKLERCFRKSVKPASKNTKRNQHWRSSERVELWELSHK